MNIGKTLRKERPRLIKLPYRNVMWVISFFFFFLAKVVRLFWKINETEEKEIRDFYNVLYRNYNYVSFRNFNSEKQTELATLSLTLMHLF